MVSRWKNISSANEAGDRFGLLKMETVDLNIDGASSILKGGGGLEVMVEM